MPQPDHFRVGLELVEVVRLLLHPLAPQGLLVGAVVGAPVRITDGVGELVLDEVSVRWSI